MKKKDLLLFGTLPTLMLSLAPCVMAQDASPAPSSGKYITVEEYEKYKKEMNAKFDSLVTELKKARETKSVSQDERDAELEELARQLKSVKHDIAAVQPGFSNIVISGDAAFGYIAPKHGLSSFNAGIAPFVLWKLNDKLLVEAGVDIAVDNATADGSGESVFSLDVADASYFLCDYLTVGGGLFVVPFARYHNHFDPSWITKLPDDPMAFADGGLAPGSEIGFFAKGAIPIQSTRLTYDFYVTNGPRLLTDPATAGTLSFDAFDDNNNNKAVGGRVGFLPLPELEFGYSALAAQVNAPDINTTKALLQAFDLQYKRDIEAIAGTIDFHTEIVWSHVDSTLRSNRWGGYTQLAYRPSLMSGPIRNVEGVFRYDWLYSPVSVPSGEHEERYTLGLNYWILPNAVFKTAYEFDHKKVGPSNDMVMMQLGLGF